MKFTVKMIRNPNCPWRGKIGEKDVSACPSDVSILFAMGRARTATFEISNTRPREYEDYHVFRYNEWGHYRVIEVTHGQMPSVTTHVSRVIRDAFLEKKEVTSPIYVSVY